jgi:hypothetical protein
MSFIDAMKYWKRRLTSLESTQQGCKQDGGCKQCRVGRLYRYDDSSTCLSCIGVPCAIVTAAVYGVILGANLFKAWSVLAVLPYVTHLWVEWLRRRKPVPTKAAGKSWYSFSHTHTGTVVHHSAVVGTC